MQSVKCPSCGASGSGIICAYCGTQMRDTSEEQTALAEYHEILKSKSGAELEKLLQHGYLPESDKGLIQAGLACVPLLNEDLETETADPAHAAANRLEAIISRLRINDRSQQAVTEFETHLQKFRTERTRSTRIGCVVLVLVPVMILAVVLWLLLR